MFHVDKGDDSSGSSKSQRRAAVLSYRDHQSRAPVVVAKGINDTADRIIAAAKEAGVPITRSSELSAVLMNIDLSSEISPELYVVVAELLAWVWTLDTKNKQI